MKSLSLSRPLVIMVIGIPGSGKSFFARQFAGMFGAPLVSSDFIRHTLFPESQYTAEEDAYVQTLATNELTELLKTSKTIVVDGGMNARAARTSTERQAKTHGYGVLTVWVQTDDRTSFTRSSKRSSKRQNDALNASITSESFARLKKQFGVPSKIENVIVISGKHTYSTQARVVLKKLVAPRDTQVVGRPHESHRTDINSESTPDVQPQRRNVTIN